jgi:uncharacterized protein (DUF2344 family)
MNETARCMIRRVTPTAVFSVAFCSGYTDHGIMTTANHMNMGVEEEGRKDHPSGLVVSILT